MKRLNGIDAMLLYSETPNLHTHTLKVAILHDVDGTGAVTFETMRETFQQRLPLLDPLRYELVEIPWKLHHPMWAEESDVDLDYHLRKARVAGPGGRRELDTLIGEIASTPLDRSRPLWEFYFVEGMADNRFALVGKVHHALADGVASANLLARALGLTGTAPAGREATIPTQRRSASALVGEAMRDHVGQFREIPALVGDAVRGITRVRRKVRERGPQPDMAQPFKPPPTFLNHVVSPVRRFASAPVALGDVKDTAKQLGVTFNDVLLAVATRALRELLLRYDGRADRPILASVPVSTDRSAERCSGNKIGGLAVSLPVHIDDPLRQIRLIANATSMAKEDSELVGPALYGRAMEYLPTAIAPGVFRWQAKRADKSSMMNVPVSNVAGPRQQGNFGGAVVTEIYSTGILSPGVGINITVWSYADQVDIAVLADDQTFRDVHEATDAMLHALAEIRSAAGLSAHLTAVDTAISITGAAI